MAFKNLSEALASVLDCQSDEEASSVIMERMKAMTGANGDVTMEDVTGFINCEPGRIPTNDTEVSW